MSSDILKFTKMEGTGNDYIYVDALDAPEPPRFSAETIAALSHRRFGIGSDGLVILAPSEQADARMIMFNADGSSSAMCGNALRCITYLMARRHGNTDHRREFTLESGAGLHRAAVLEMNGVTGIAEVDMGAPVFAAAKIPFEPAKLTSGTTADASTPGTPFVDLPFHLPGFGDFRATMLSMGNPHCVIFTEDADAVPLEEIGPVLESHPAFPERVNVEFVSPDADGGLYQRTFERGSGETLACGSGACAVQVAAVLTNRGGEKNRIRLRGGSLELEWSGGTDNPGNVIMRGPVRLVFEGERVRA